VVSPDDVLAALGDVARRHPLLTATVHVGAPGHAVFRRTVDPIPMQVTGEPDWERVVEEELATPLPAVGSGSSCRAVLIHGPNRQTVILTFAHHIADARAAVRVLDDLVAALNGAPLGTGAVPAPREALLARLPSVQAVIDDGPPGERFLGAEDGRQAPPKYLPAPARPVLPSVRAASIDADIVEMLRRRAMDEGATLRGAVLAATALEVAEQRGIDLVRITSPMSLEPLIGEQDGTGVFTTAARTATAPDAGTGFWDLAREHVRLLAPARSAVAVGNEVAAFVAATGPTATPESAADFLGRGPLALDTVVTDVGVVSPTHRHRVGIRRFWGPIGLAQVEHENGVSAATLRGAIRITEVTRDSAAGLVEGIAARLRITTI
jgi:hypothetical protein